MTDKKLEPHLERMAVESSELSEKISKLDDFIEYNPIFQTLDVEDHLLMRLQLYHMQGYHSALSKRFHIAVVGKPKATT